MKKLLRYLVNTILFVVLWCLMFLPVMKYSIDMGATSIAAIGGIVAIIISYSLVKKINKSNLWASLFDETEAVNNVVEEKESKASVKLDSDKIKKASKKNIVSKGWIRLHIVISILISSIFSIFHHFEWTLLLIVGYWLLFIIIWKIRKNYNHIISKGWIQLHIIASIIIAVIFTILQSVGYDSIYLNHLFIGGYSIVSYWLIVLIVSWLIQGFKEE